MIDLPFPLLMNFPNNEGTTAQGQEEGCTETTGQMFGGTDRWLLLALRLNANLDIILL